jgi:hypothetical protein
LDASPPAAKTLLTSGDSPPVDPAKPPVDPAKPAEAPKPAPDKYDFSALKLPQGITLSNDIVDAVSPVLKKYGLTQEAASELVTAHGEATAKLMAAAEVKAEADFQTMMADEAKKNIAAITKEWGNDFKPNLEIAQRGLARLFPGADGKRLLDETGLGNHPEFLNAFLAVGKMIQEDKPPNGQVPSGRKSNAEVFYPAAQ